MLTVASSPPQFDLEEQLSLFIKDEVYHMSNVLHRRPLDDLSFRQLIADNVAVITNRVQVMSCQYERERVSSNTIAFLARKPHADFTLVSRLCSRTRATSRSLSRSSRSSTGPRTGTTSLDYQSPTCPSSNLKKDVRYPPPRPAIIRTTRPAALQCLRLFHFLYLDLLATPPPCLFALSLSLSCRVHHIFLRLSCVLSTQDPSRVTEKSVGGWSSGDGRKWKLALKKRSQTKRPIDAEKDRIPIETRLGFHRGFSLVGRPRPGACARPAEKACFEARPSVPLSTPSSRQVRPPIPLRLLSRVASNSPVGYQHTHLPSLFPTNLSPSKVRNPARALPFSPPAEIKQKGGRLLVVATQTSMDWGCQKADSERGSVVGRGWI